MPVSDENVAQVLKADAGLQDLALCTFAAVDQEAESVMLDDLRRKPRLAEGAEADVPRKMISNMLVIVPHSKSRMSPPKEEQAPVILIPAGSGQLPGNQMYMKMGDGLPAMSTGIDHQPVTVFGNARLRRQFFCHQDHVPTSASSPGSSSLTEAMCRLGMMRICVRAIGWYREMRYLLIAVDNAGRGFTGKNFTEDAGHRQGSRGGELRDGSVSGQTTLHNNSFRRVYWPGHRCSLQADLNHFLQVDAASVSQ